MSTMDTVNLLRAAPEVARARTRTLATFTRHGAISAATRVTTSRVASPARQIVLMLCGSALIGFGVSAFRAADLGLPPYDVLLSAIDRATVLSHGQAAWGVSGFLLLVAAGLGQRARPTTLLFVLANGFAVDGAHQILRAPDGLTLRLAMLAAGIAAIAYGISVVVHSGLTGGSFEMLTRAGEARGLKGPNIRLALEAGVLTLGIISGGAFGFGTVVFALVIGRLMGVLTQALADHRAGRAARLH